MLNIQTRIRTYLNPSKWIRSRIRSENIRTVFTPTSYHSVLARTIVVHRRVLKSCEITPTAFVVWPPLCTRGNKARGVSTGSLIVKMAVSIQERLARRHVGDPLARGQARGYPWSYPIGSLALARDSLRGAPMRTRGKFARFLIPR